MTLNEMILDWELNGEATESNELVRMEKLIRALIAERKVRAGQAGDAGYITLETAVKICVDAINDGDTVRAALIAALAKEKP